VGSSGQNGAGGNIYQAIPNLPSTKTDYSVGLQVSIPLYDPTREQGEVNAGVALRQADLQTAQADDVLQQQVTDAVRNIDTARRQLDLSGLKPGDVVMLGEQGN
jgi:outer membrane protein TolC